MLANCREAAADLATRIVDKRCAGRLPVPADREQATLLRLGRKRICVAAELQNNRERRAVTAVSTLRIRSPS